MIVALIAVAPFVAAVFAPWIKTFAGPSAGWILAIVPAAIFATFISFIGPIADFSVIRVGLDWIPAYGISFSFFIDGLSLVFGVLISGIGTFIVIYSGGYLAGHPHQGRFFSYILMFMGSMLGLVLADNVFTLFVFWELTSITSFLLIGFDHSRQAARRAAIQALVVTGGGGLALLAGLILLTLITGQNSLTGMLTTAGAAQESALYLVAMLLVVAGAFAKSAQVPLHFWLPNAMEAPTPVSAYLHSATMVKAGVYLLARMTPILGDTEPWFWTLTIFGGTTLLMGGALAVRQTDLKQMLAYTTLGSLGLLVLLIGFGTKEAILGALLYLCAHSLFKGALFMVAGTIDHGTGTRDITVLGGLREAMPITFIAAVLAGFSMAGFPIAIGFLAKEEMYLALTSGLWPDLLFLAVLIIGNALMMVVGLLIAFKPFLGDLRPTPHAPHEGPLSLYSGPVVLAVLGICAGLFTDWINHAVLDPAGGAIYNAAVDAHIHLAFDLTNPAVWASITTWALGGVLFWKADAVRSALRRTGETIGWTFDIGFDAFMSGLVRFADRTTRLLHHGRLEWYLLLMFTTLAVGIFAPLLVTDSLPPLPAWPVLNFYEWGAIGIAAIGLIAVLASRTRLTAIVALGIQGFAVAVIFMLFGAPDLSFTQFMVETLTVIILALVMTRLHLDEADSRDLETAVRDGVVSLAVGLGIAVLLLVVLQTDLDLSLTELFRATSTPIAHGRNIVNVILVDYRAIDTLGEISVVMAAGLAILALIRLRASTSGTRGARAGRGRKTGSAR
ncbi:multisubunit sodium/proton antiporter, MrpA subunit [Pelagibacterium halotolerans]|uniref:Na(+) H(+) antiporter subunit A n=1 Tax=Pelagibacterium halotolerans (strain DSM 22347 / JCM 15775 / CGMCC 1.7692 / B2) TaxID=1082931 RepID=G4RCI6_PELHB|nr:Na(+) H(+) antiporter subunit A [Pelagibacterium halotolerans B2]SDZ92266.1 multisubunit sodium/proton antiporter, MrpA subunit [Pelagibacterium halotolerans]